MTGSACRSPPRRPGRALARRGAPRGSKAPGGRPRAWRNDDVRSSVFTEGDGQTRTNALWAQDAWYITPDLKLTFGGRYEDWRGYDGLNVSGTTTVVQKDVDGKRFSPKGLLTWNATEKWTLTAAVGKAYRFA